MANGSDRITQLEASFSAKSDQRDRQLAELATSLATVAESQRGEGSRNDALEARLSALENRPTPKPPSILEVWGPAVATAAILGGLGSWVVDKSIGPIEKEASKVEMRVRSDAEIQRRLEIEYAEKYGHMAGRVDVLQDLLKERPR